jgi:hypothetical protein
MSKRKLPDTMACGGAVPKKQGEAGGEAALDQSAIPDDDSELSQALAAAQSSGNYSVLPETPPRRIQKGSPADDFLNTPARVEGTSSDDSLTCDITLIAKDKFNRRRKLIAVIIGVEPIVTKSDPPNQFL